jgi:uncharacterized zinc-type alcohol dehydrogenase-like protein
MPIHTYAANAAKGRLEPFDYEPGPIEPDAVDVAITHCGICHSDVAMVDNDWGFSRYPLVPGHEVVGTVSAVGRNVTALKVGQRVGVGWQCGSCMECEWCLRGAQNCCPKEVDTIVGHHGGFATHVRAANWRFAYPIPDAIDSEHAGPLMCAGTTVFTPIVRYGVKPTHRAAVVGIGGLGHLAVQFLAQWGCDVTAISTSHDKDAQAKQLGATHFIATRGTAELKKAANSFDFILCTVTADLPWADYMAALRPQGKLCIVGVPDKPMTLPAFALIAGERSLVGGRAGPLGDTADMLDFAARHGVKPIIETFPMAEADRALDHTRQGKARFRAVLVA